MGELIIQICRQRGELDHKFSALTEKFEDTDIQIIDASYTCVSKDRSCFHLHVSGNAFCKFPRLYMNLTNIIAQL